MFTFQKQKQILEPVLKNPANNICADCHAIAPTWASLDFGVFLCSDCAGAHRALGPTITRVKSANLDLWKEEWLPLMVLGNQAINTYWEADSSAQLKKPKTGASPQQISRYAYEKYVKRKFVKDPSQPDPLTAYKQNGMKPPATEESKEQRAPQVRKPEVKTEAKPVVTTKPKVETNLLDFDFDHPPASNPPVIVQSVNQPTENSPIVTQAPQPSQQVPLVAPSLTQQAEHATSFTAESGSSNLMSFDQLMSQHQAQPQPPPPAHHMSQQSLGAGQHHNSMNMHHPYYPHQGQTNLVYNSHYQQASQLSHMQPSVGHYGGGYHPHLHQPPTHHHPQHPYPHSYH